MDDTANAIVEAPLDDGRPIARHEDWYRACLEECDAIRVEKKKIVAEETVAMYLLLGARVLEETKNAPITKLVQALSTDLGMGERTLWKAVAVVREYGADINALPIEGTVISWKRVKALPTSTAVSGKVAARYEGDFDPYKFALSLSYQHSPEDCRIIATELLRVGREGR